MDFIGIREFKTLEAIEKISSEDEIAVALSGGPDSMALVYLLSQATARKGRTVIHALTVDHGLRPESAAEARQAGAWVKDWPCVRHAVLSIEKIRNKTRIMEQARDGRYELMADYCRRKKIRYLLLAHHQDDQAETFLFRLAKGSGLDGLAAMKAFQAYDENLVLVRPFLDIPKERLVATCTKNKIPYVSDPSNENPAYARPRLRQARDVLAAEGLTAGRLAVTAGRMARARAALEHYAAASFQQALKEKTVRKVIFSLPVLQAAPEDIRLRVMLEAIDGLVSSKGYGVRLEKVEALARDMFASGPFRRRTLGGVIFSRVKGEIWLEKEK